MSRHRNVRSMNYSEEYEGYDDVYGHSVEDDYTISPSDAAFMYDRTNKPQMSAFFSEDDIAEEDENVEVSCDKRSSEPDVTKLQSLSDEDRVRLQSCLDEIRNVIGDSIPEQTVIKKILAYDFDVNKTLDAVLSEATANPQPTPEDFRSAEPAPRPDKVFREPVAPAQITVTEAAQPTVKVVLPTNVTRGFDVSSSKIEINSVDGLRPKSATPRTQSPASGRQTPITSGRQTPNPEVGDGDGSVKESRTPARSRISKDDILAKYASERGGSKEQIHMVVIGHVDAGKSTLMGRLLFELGQVQKKTMHKYEQESRKLGKTSFVYAWILDETGEERSRGITMDVAQSKFETDSKIVTLLDAPGHKDFIPNMITGASQADVALLVVDATRGEFETGFELGGQTREHALLVRSLGVSQVGVVVNKLDTVDWAQERFTEITEKMSAFLKQAGFRESEVTFVPCSGMTGQNLVTKPTEDTLLSWYSGPTLLDVIDKFKTPERPVTKPFRLSVNDVFKGLGSGFCVSGKIETGMLQTGDKVLIQPVGETATIKALTLDEMPVQAAFAGDYVSATLAGVDQQNISVGNVICDPSQPIAVTSRFEARIVLFQLKVPLTKGYSVVLHHQSLAEQAVVSKLISQLHKSNGTVLKKSPRCLLGNSVAVVELRTSRPVCMELYSNIKELGRVMLRVGGVTIAAGLVTKIYC